MNLNNTSLNSSTGFSLPPPKSGVGIHSNMQRGGANAANSTIMSGFGALNYSTDSNMSGSGPVSLPRNNHLLNAPHFRKERHRHFRDFPLAGGGPVLTTSAATPPPTSQLNPAGGAQGQMMTPVNNIISETANGEDSFGTPTFGLLQPRGATNTWRVWGNYSLQNKQTNINEQLPFQVPNSLALRLDFSSPSLSVLSPFLPANAVPGGGSGGTTPGGNTTTGSGVGGQGNVNEKEKSEKIKEENNQNESPAPNPEKAPLMSTRKRVS